jgi:hypothetical protein
MRTTWLMVAVLGTAGLAGCDAFSAQSNVVATSAGRRLETDRLVSMLASIRAPVTTEAADVITDIWVNMTLGAQARVGGDLADSAAVARVMRSADSPGPDAGLAGHPQRAAPEATEAFGRQRV